MNKEDRKRNKMLLFPARYGMSCMSQAHYANVMMQQELRKLHKQGYFPLIHDEYIKKSEVVRRLYNFAYDSAYKHGVYHHTTILFLLELAFTDYTAYDCCCSDIACTIVGG